MKIFCVSYHVPGTLAANEEFIFSLPFDAQLVGASVVATNASDATFGIGDTVNPSLYTGSKLVGDSKVPTLLSTRNDFVGSQYAHILAGTKIEVFIDFDGAVGVAAQNLTVLLIFTEG